ncbi:MAG: MFS transporter [Rhodospirillales bacterium]|nr:MFS transporter [Rhodospirillales bacterium]
MNNGTTIAVPESAGAAAEPGLARIIVLCAAGGFLDGYDLLIMGAALLLLVPDFHLKGAEIGMLTSLPFLAMAIGALTAGRLCDRFGRRTIYLFDVVLFLVFAILQALAQNLWQLGIMRFCVGFAIGMDMPTGSAMLAEYSPPGWRGALTTMLNTAWLVGGCVATLVGFVLYQTAGPGAWRWMFAAAAVPAVIVAVMRHSLPETPYWRRAAEPVAERPPAERAGFAAVLGSRYRAPVLFFTIYWMVQAFAGGPPFIYTALIFNSVLHLKGAEALLLNAVLLAIYAALSLLFQFTLLERWGRKPFAALFCALAGIGAIATSFLSGAGIGLVAAFSLFAVSTQMSTIPFWPWSVEQLPTRVRATGQSIGSAGGKVGLFAGIFLFSPPFIKSMGWMPYFVLVGAIFAALVLFVLVLGRETRATPLEA